jgi:hypothetical protein
MTDEVDDDTKPLIDLSAYTRKRPSRFDSGRRVPGRDPTPDEPLARADPRAIPKMGEQPRLPKPKLEHPEMTDNPMHAGLEPVTIEPYRQPIKPDYARTAVRRVVPAEIDGLIAWGLPRFQKRFPRCTAQSIWGTLNLACQGGQMYFVRTESACGLFVAERTPWEPELAVYDVFVVKKRDLATDDERDAIYRAGLRWAEEIGAVTYQFGTSTGVKLDAVAAKFGCDIPVYGYIKVLR